MANLVWDPDALKTYRALTDPRRGLPPLRRAQLVERIDALGDWPPDAWYDLRDQRDGAITFRMETDQFLEILGLYEDGVVKITHMELKTKKRG